MRKLFFLLGLCVLVCLNSCLVSKKVVYFKDMEADSAYKVLPVPPIKIQKGDRLSIQVSSRNPELAVPFNSSGGLYSVEQSGSVSNTGLIDRGYLVDQQGNIDFPILGTLNIEGMSLDGLRDYIVNQLVSNKLLNGPVVKVELQNLKVIIMGETRNVVVNAPDGRMTILEAIAKGQGLGINAAPDKITVIREENGYRRLYYNNIESKEIFNSPTFYLQQNDIIYIEPLASETRGDEARTWRIMSMVTSILSLTVTTWAILTR